MPSKPEWLAVLAEAYYKIDIFRYIYSGKRFRLFWM